MVQSSKTFRIFVSSTFSDLKEERNILQKYAFPRLRELCAQHGFKFQAIDLRWGVSEEAGLDQQTMNICLQEIERSQKVSPKPNFIVLLGNRYGWQPLPAEIKAEEFERILEKVSADEEELLLWKEEQPEGKKGWYRLDENAVPAVYCLQPRTGEYVNYDNWTQVEQKMHSILLEAASKLDLDEDNFLKYYASATEQEIVRGALKVEDAQDHVFCFFRDIENLPDNKDFVDLDSNGNIDEDAQEKLENLKGKLRAQLPESHIKEYNTKWADNGISEEHLKKLCNDVYEKLECIILEKIEEIEEIEPLDQEIEAHEEFGEDRAKFFTGRTEISNDIVKYLENGNGSPLAIYGESGSGKSALMAKAVIDAKENYLNVHIISRFIGVTPKSTNIRFLLENLCEQIYRDFNFEEDKQRRLIEISGDDERKIVGDEFEIPSEIQKLTETFKRFLDIIPPNKKLILFLDALDQLSNSNNAHSLNWLPDNLPDNVHIVVSSLGENFYYILKNKILEENLLKLDQLAKVEGENLLNLWLNDGKRKLQIEQWNEVINKFQVEGLPLYLKLAFEEAKNWKSYTTTPDLAQNISGIN